MVVRTSELCPVCPEDAFDGRLIHQDAFMRSALSLPRMHWMHAIVLPRRHVEPPDLLTGEEAVAMLGEVERIRGVFIAAGKVATSVTYGVDVFQKTRVDVTEGTGGTKLDHLHWHVVGSEPGTERYESSFSWGPDQFSIPTMDQMAQDLHALRQVGL